MKKLLLAISISALIFAYGPAARAPYHGGQSGYSTSLRDLRVGQMF